MTAWAIVRRRQARAPASAPPSSSPTWAAAPSCPGRWRPPARSATGWCSSLPAGAAPSDLGRRRVVPGGATRSQSVRAGTGCRPGRRRHHRRARRRPAAGPPGAVGSRARGRRRRRGRCRPGVARHRHGERDRPGWSPRHPRPLPPGGRANPAGVPGRRTAPGSPAPAATPLTTPPWWRRPAVEWCWSRVHRTT